VSKLRIKRPVHTTGLFVKEKIMIKRKNEQTIEVRKNMRGGEGEVKFIHYFTKGEIKAPCRLFSDIILSPGSSIGPHEHSGEDEVYVIRQGKGLMIDGDKEFTVETGDAVLTGSGASHSVKNIGNEDLIITAVIMSYHA